ncbi:HNH endonuclease family protein [Corynebacterium choanae]|uniref:HNH endonuclease family protein n=1 Tax=Corynebacterium choanae TaxID=1862358 RepID=UPI000F513FA5|nr:HNH endonuclease family protein [Corynebacterium choanae]
MTANEESSPDETRWVDEDNAAEIPTTAWLVIAVHLAEDAAAGQIVDPPALAGDKPQTNAAALDSDRPIDMAEAAVSAEDAHWAVDGSVGDDERYVASSPVFHPPTTRYKDHPPHQVTQHQADKPHPENKSQPGGIKPSLTGNSDQANPTAQLLATPTPQTTTDPGGNPATPAHRAQQQGVAETITTRRYPVVDYTMLRPNRGKHQRRLPTPRTAPSHERQTAADTASTQLATPPPGHRESGTKLPATQQSASAPVTGKPSPAGTAAAPPVAGHLRNHQLAEHTPPRLLRLGVLAATWCCLLLWLIPGFAPITDPLARPLQETLPQVAIVQHRPARDDYQRIQFGSWAADAILGSGCTTRSRELLSGLRHARIDPANGRCRILFAPTPDPYSGSLLTRANHVEIDHIYPLAAAWDMGAATWERTRRIQFANDPINVVAVAKQANREKSDALPGDWMPPQRRRRCWYARRVAAVAATYDLPLTRNDRITMLAACPTDWLGLAQGFVTRLVAHPADSRHTPYGNRQHATNTPLHVQAAGRVTAPLTGAGHGNDVTSRRIPVRVKGCK